MTYKIDVAEVFYFVTNFLWDYQVQELVYPHPIVPVINKANRNVWHQFIDNRTRQRPFIRDIQQQRFELRPVQLSVGITGFTQVLGYDNERFQAGTRAYRFSSNNQSQRLNIGNVINSQSQILNMINNLIKNFVRINRLQPNDALNLQVESPELRSPIFINTLVKNVSSTQLFDRIRQTLQSAEYIELSTATFVFNYVRNTTGGAFRSNASKDDIYKKKSVVKQVYNTNEEIEDCFFQCLVLGLAELNIKVDEYKENEVSYEVLTSTKNDKYKKELNNKGKNLLSNLVNIWKLILNLFL